MLEHRYLSISTTKRFMPGLILQAPVHLIQVREVRQALADHGLPLPEILVEREKGVPAGRHLHTLLQPIHWPPYNLATPHIYHPKLVMKEDVPF